jgi:type I restriction-modification system DNA methylase subunit
MALSWNEIKDRAVTFSKEWDNAFNEDAEAKVFLYKFFDVFGINQRKVSTFEYRVKKLDLHDGYIDMLWKGTLLIEMKSRGKNLEKAFDQAKEYLHGLKQYELPKYILVSDFKNFRLHNLEENSSIEFQLQELVNNVHHFDFIAGYPSKIYTEQDPANIKAAELMGKLHDRLKEIGYNGHPLEVYLVRILFCLFAEDTTIFQKQQFQDYIELRTNEDGSDLASKIQELFQVLNTSREKRFKNIDEQLSEFPFINGKLFEEMLPSASFDSKMRNALLECCYLDWSKISPAIFGSMFQSVMNPVERRNLGAHYTSEKNILKVIKPLFLDELWAEFDSVKGNSNKLNEFHKKISRLKFLDPACGCGNFLVITYRELRLLEIEILRNLYKSGQSVLNIDDIIWLNVDMMYGIEIEEFPARIAEVAMWLIDHQMNMLVGKEFGQYFIRLPLTKSANIVHGNALLIDWNSLLDKQRTVDIYAQQANIYKISEPEIKYGVVNIYAENYNIIDTLPQSEQSDIHFDYIMGNPPFVGKKEQNLTQKSDLEKVFIGINATGVLDYVSAWYFKAAKLIQYTKTKVAFVSTNSISQGEQVGILWSLLFNRYKIKIHFAHRTFKWSNEAKGNAAVHCVIIGFANYDSNHKIIYEYEDIKGDAKENIVNNINPYLIESKDSFLINRKNPICSVPKMNYGSMPIDNGHLIISDEERNYFIKQEPITIDFIRPYTGGDEFINNIKRWCLWLVGIEPNIVKNSKLIINRLQLTKEFRKNSKRKATIKLAEFPSLFGENRQPKNDYIIIPKVSSEKRKYIPIGILKPNVITNGSALIISDSNLYHFGIITSIMHITWMSNVCGRMKSDYQYSVGIVYNNFPWPENPSEKQINKVETAAQKVLDARSLYPDCSLADLYDPLSMPPELIKAHNELDKAVDLCYRPQPFSSNVKRMEFLFKLYEKYTLNLFVKKKT